jgi:hypothetical protein
MSLAAANAGPERPSGMAISVPGFPAFCFAPKPFISFNVFSNDQHYGGAGAGQSVQN